MDALKYKDTTTSRGIRYHYYLSPPSNQQPYLLFLHGFPSTSFDWRHQVRYFEKQGYGLVVPDMIGYGGTDKPADPMEYRSSLITKDLIEILDYEKVEKVVAVGHDWGSKITSRLANYFPERFVAFAFLAVGYRPPSPTRLPIEEMLALMKQFFGSELFGYIPFCSEPGADRVIEDHLDSFMSLLFAEEAELFIDHFCPTGAMKKWITEDRMTERASYISAEELTTQTEALRRGGLAGPLSWYKIFTSDIDFEDDRAISKDNFEVTQPVFFAAANRDYASRPATQTGPVDELCKNATIKYYDASHWVMIHRPEELNRDLHSWLQAHSL